MRFRPLTTMVQHNSKHSASFQGISKFMMHFSVDNNILHSNGLYHLTTMHASLHQNTARHFLSVSNEMHFLGERLPLLGWLQHSSFEHNRSYESTTIKVSVMRCISQINIQTFFKWPKLVNLYQSKKKKTVLGHIMLTV